MNSGAVAPRAYGTKAALLRPEAHKGGPSMKALLKNTIALAVCAFILREAQVIQVMIASKKIHRELMYVSLAFHSVMLFVGLYLTWVVAWSEPNWSKNDKYNPHIHVATICMLIGSVLWTIALFPVFHMWTIPLGVLGVIAIVCLLTLTTLIPLPFGKAKPKA